MVNIGPRERKKRLIMGGALLVGGVGIAVALTLAGLGRWWRLALFLPFWVGALGVFQARART